MSKVQLCSSGAEWPLSVSNRNGKHRRENKEIVFWLA